MSFFSFRRMIYCIISWHYAHMCYNNYRDGRQTNRRKDREMTVEERKTVVEKLIADAEREKEGLSRVIKMVVDHGGDATSVAVRFCETSQRISELKFLL